MPDEPIACVGVPTWNLTNVCASARARMPRAEHNDEPRALAARSLLREAGTSNVTCSLAAATRRLQLDFVFVGLEEEFFLSIQALEAILPRWFRNATQTLAQTGTLRQGSMRNPLTNTTMLGSVSRTTRQILEKHALGYANEVKFYETAKRLFWSRVALAVLPLPPRPTLSREHYLQSARTRSNHGPDTGAPGEASGHCVLTPTAAVVAVALVVLLVVWWRSSRAPRSRNPRSMSRTGQTP